MNAQQNLIVLNSHREAEGLAPFAAWRKARHEPMLSAYLEKAKAVELANEKAMTEQAKAIKAVKAAKETPATDEPKPLSYKHLARKAPAKSGVGTPVQFVHQFLAANPTLTRKQAMAALVDAGVNFSTARTQYQKWFTANKKG